MSTRSAGVFCSHPAVFPGLYQTKAGVTSLQTSLLHLTAFVLPVPALLFFRRGAISTLGRRLPPHQLAVSECVNACLKKQLGFVLSIYGREGGGSVERRHLAAAA